MPTGRRPALRNESDFDKMRRRFVQQSERGIRGIELVCPNGCVWSSAIDGKSIPRMGLRVPRCPNCNEPFDTWATIGTYKHVEGKVCDRKCKRAKPYSNCICSCERNNHGIEHPTYRGGALVDDPLLP